LKKKWRGGKERGNGVHGAPPAPIPSNSGIGRIRGKKKRGAEKEKKEERRRSPDRRCRRGKGEGHA